MTNNTVVDATSSPVLALALYGLSHVGFGKMSEQSSSAFFADSAILALGRFLSSSSSSSRSSLCNLPHGELQ